MRASRSLASAAVLDGSEVPHRRSGAARLAPVVAQLARRTLFPPAFEEAGCLGSLPRNVFLKDTSLMSLSDKLATRFRELVAPGLERCACELRTGRGAFTVNKTKVTQYRPTGSRRRSQIRLKPSIANEWLAPCPCHSQEDKE